MLAPLVASVIYQMMVCISGEAAERHRRPCAAGAYISLGMALYIDARRLKRPSKRGDIIAVHKILTLLLQSGTRHGGVREIIFWYR